MGMTDTERRALKGGTTLPADPAVAPPILVEPLAVRLGDATTISGLSRSDLYRRAAKGEVVFLKAGNRIVVEFQSLKAVIGALPRAVISVAV